MSEPRATANRRLVPRRKPKKSAKVVCFAGRFGLGPNVAVSLLDVSDSGARLVLKEPLTAGHEVEIGLETISERRPAKAVAHVMWCVALADGNHCAGFRFEKPLRYNFLQALVSI